MGMNGFILYVKENFGVISYKEKENIQSCKSLQSVRRELLKIF